MTQKTFSKLTYPAIKWLIVLELESGNTYQTPALGESRVDTSQVNIKVRQITEVFKRNFLPLMHA